MQKVNYIFSVVFISFGIICTVLSQVNIIQEGALLLSGPMIVIGLWLFAYSMSRRGNGKTR